LKSPLLAKSIENPLVLSFGQISKHWRNILRREFLQAS
jgi:hypothetical protein